MLRCIWKKRCKEILNIEIPIIINMEFRNALQMLCIWNEILSTGVFLELRSVERGACFENREDVQQVSAKLYPEH